MKRRKAIKRTPKKKPRNDDRVKAGKLTAEDMREAEAGEAGSRPPGWKSK